VALLADFRAFATEYGRLVRDDLGENPGRPTHRHPWFGPLEARRWHCFATFHLQVHRRQLQEIRRALSSGGRDSRTAGLLLPADAELDPSP